MSQIKPTSIKKAKRPKDLIQTDLSKVKIVPTKEELDNIPIIDQWAAKMHLEGGSNIPRLFKHIFDKSVMIQILDAFTNRMICVGDEGQKVNTNPIGEDFDCFTCEHFIKPCDEFPKGHCGWAQARFKERFGDEIPEGLDELVKNSMDNNQHKELTDEEVKQISDSIYPDGEIPENEFTDKPRIEKREERNVGKPESD